MKRNILKIAVLAGAACASSALAQGPLEENPFVKLYVNRVDMAKTVVERQQATVALTEAQLARISRAYNSGAASREEYDVAVANKAVALKQLKEFEIRIREQEQLLRIAFVRVGAGQDMPICTPYQ